MAKSLAEHIETCNPEEAFIAGLTLGVGFLIFFAMFIKGSGEGIGSGLDSLEKLLAWEQERFGVNHREVGAAALRYWKFPDSIIVCQAGYLHHPGSSPLSKVCELARIMSISLLGRGEMLGPALESGRELWLLNHDTLLSRLQEQGYSITPYRSVFRAVPNSGRT